MRVVVFLIMGFSASIATMAQQPVIDSIVNGASFAIDPERINVIAAGEILTIFGKNLATSTVTAPSLPLPKTLGGTSVLVNGMPVALFYVSPSQINFQNLTGPFVADPKLPPVQFPIIVRTAAGDSEPAMSLPVSSAPGIFAQGGQNCGPGSIQNVGPDGTATLNTALNSASPGDFVTIYGTGFGNVFASPHDGSPAVIGPLSFAENCCGAYLGPDGFERFIPHETPRNIYEYYGRVPGLVGVDQANIRIPEDAPEGCAVPVRLRGSSGASQPVTMSMRRGGGRCEDPKPARFAILKFHRVVTVGPGAGISSSLEVFTAEFGEAPENMVRQRAGTIPFGGCTAGSDISHAGPSCSAGQPRGLTAGALKIEGLPSGPVAVQPSTNGAAYMAILTTGSMRGGPLRISTAGGSDIGPFQVDVTLPAPIQITTDLSPGTVISYSKPFGIAWTGGTEASVLRMDLIGSDAGGTISGAECNFLASAGELSLDPTPIRACATCPLAYQLPVYRGYAPEVVVRVSTRAGSLATFTAPGLTIDGTVEWLYEYRFKGLTFGN